MPDRNKMFIADVVSSSELEVTTFKPPRNRKAPSPDVRVSRAYVHAVKPCGCDGPWIGTLTQIVNEKVNSALILNERIPNASLWAIRAVSAKDGYRENKKVIGYAYGKMHAAQFLKDYVVLRNINRPKKWSPYAA